MDIFNCQEQGDVFIDSLVTDHAGYLVFASIYGRDSSIQQLLSRMHLSTSGDGIDRLTAISARTGSSLAALLGDPKRLDKTTGQLPKGSLFGRMSHVWVFDKAVSKPNRAARTGWLLFDREHSQGERDQKCWAMVKHLSPLPLLDHWREGVLTLLQALSADVGPCIDVGRCVGPASAVRVSLNTDFEKMISAAIKSGYLGSRSKTELADRSLALAA